LRSHRARGCATCVDSPRRRGWCATRARSAAGLR
jgi:hypothetical protein